MILIITCNDDELSGGVVCLGPNIQSWMLLGAGDGGKLNDDDESRSPQEIVKKSILDVDFKRKIIKLLHMGQFLQGGKNGHLMSFFFLKVEPPCDQT